MPSNVAATPLTVRWYRNRQRCLLIYGGAAIAPLALAYLTIGKSNPAWTALGALAILVAIWQIAGAALAGFGVSRDALIVRSPLWTRHRVPWAEIASFNVSRPGQRTESVVVAIRTDGRLLHTGGCTFRAGDKGHSRAQAMAAELNTDRLAPSGAAPTTLAPSSRAGHRRPGTLTYRHANKVGTALGIVCVIGTMALGARLIADAATSIGPALRASHGQGVRGSFFPVTESCGRSCSWTGNFVLPDGTVTLRNVGFNTGSAASISVGHSVPALNTGDTSMVFPANDGTQWLFQIGELAAGAFFFGPALLIAAVALRQRRIRGFHRSLLNATG